MAAERESDEALLVTLLRMSSGDAADAEYEDLSRRVVADPAIADRVVDQMLHIADLEWDSHPVSQGSATASTERAGSVGRPTIVRTAPLPVFSTMAATILLAFLVGAVASRFVMPPGAETQVVIAPPTSDDDDEWDTGPKARLATLVRNTSYVLDAHSGSSIDAGSSLRAGSSVALFEGVAELEFEDGVSVLMKGPAILELQSEGRPALKYGRLVTRHVPDGLDWRLAIPMSEIEVPFGAVVGVDAFGEEAVVHALQGSVTVHPSLGDNAPQVLSAGEAVRLRRNAHSELSLLPIDVKPESFDFESLMDDGDLDVPSDYADRVMHSRPIAYWRFDQVDSGLVADASGGEHTLHLIGEGVRVVRASGNSYVSFDVRDKRGCFVSGAPLDRLAGGDYSVEFWIKPRHYHRGSIVSLVEHATDDHGAVERHGLILETNSAAPASPAPEGIETSPRAIRFLHRSPPNDVLSGATCFSTTPYRLNAWQHVAAIKDESSLRLYIDGKLSASQSDATRLPAGLSIVVGQLFSFGSVRPYVGALDELAFYDHALDESEIASRVAWFDLSSTPVRPQPAAK